MTRRLTISLPDDVAAELDNLPAGQVSAFVAEALRRRRVSDSARVALRAAGHREFPFDPAGAQQRIAAAAVDVQARDAAVAKLAELGGNDREKVIEQLGRSAAAAGVVTAPVWIFDTGALVAFAHGVEQVGQIVADAADADVRIAVPVICLLVGAAHAVHSALIAAAGVVTSRPDQIRTVLGDGWHIVEV